MSDTTAWPEIRRFATQVGGVFLAGVLVLAYPVYSIWGPGILMAAGVGCGISTLNALFGGVSAVWAFDRPQPVFLKVVLGGMALRMVCVCVTFILLIRLTELPIYGLAVSLFMYYLLYQILEIRFLNARNARPAREGM